VHLLEDVRAAADRHRARARQEGSVRPERHGHPRIHPAPRGARGLVVHARAHREAAVPGVGLEGVPGVREAPLGAERVRLVEGRARHVQGAPGPNGELFPRGDPE
ncbi:unnamed protein product, partial [Prorocentrum cordatum]